MIDLPPKPDIWLPPHPAIIRPAKNISAYEANLGVLLCAARRRAAKTPVLLTRTYGSVGTAGDDSTPDYGTLTAPNPATGRYLLAVLVSISKNPNEVLYNSVSIGGGAATKLHEYNNRPGGFDGGTISFWYRLVATGSTATVTAVLSNTPGSARGSACWLYEITGLTSAPVLHDFANDNDNNVDDKVDLDIDCPAGGLIFGGLACGTAGSNIWTEITEDEEAALGTRDGSAASDEFATQQTGLAIDASNSSASYLVGSAISIGPS